VTDSLIGTQIEEYRLESLLGQGGMARVYRGLDTGLQRYASIKVIDTPYQQDDAYAVRFEREAQAIAQLDHPHIVTVYRYGRTENLLYLALKYIDGIDLHTILRSYERDGQFMPWAEVTRLMREIGSALDYAHNRGVIHRDVKPSNVLLDTTGRSYLTDFGLALLADVGTRGEILGSPNYIAPEQAVSSSGVVPQSDLYALGVILYRMVTGQMPFTHDDVLELLMLHMTAAPPDPRNIRPDISPALADVILKALAKEPDERYASGKALARALGSAVRGTAVPPAAEPTLTFLERIAQGMKTPKPTPGEDSQPIDPALVIQPAASTGTGPSGASVFLKGVRKALILLLILLAAFWGFRNRGNLNTLVTNIIAATTTEPVATETPKGESIAQPSQTPTIAPQDTAPPSLEPTEAANTPLLSQTPTAAAQETDAPSLELAEASSPRQTPTAAVQEAATSTLEPTVTLLPEANPPASETVYLPLIINKVE
jgi:serine/threonine protein kinase